MYTEVCWGIGVRRGGVWRPKQESSCSVSVRTRRRLTTMHLVVQIAQRAGAAVVEPAILRRNGCAGESKETVAFVVFVVVSTDGGQRTLARAGSLWRSSRVSRCAAFSTIANQL